MCRWTTPKRLASFFLVSLFLISCAEEVPVQETGDTTPGGGDPVVDDPVVNDPVVNDPIVDNNPNTGGGNPTSSVIVITNTTPSNYNWSTLITDSKVYTDRDYPYSRIPPSCEGLQVLSTANNDKTSRGENFINFVVDKPVNVYVAHASPDVAPWLASWALTGDVVNTSINDLIVYKKTFSAGNVTLGANYGGNEISMYVAFLESIDSSCTQSPAPVLNNTGSATISWVAPTTNSNGSALSDLAGFRIYYGNTTGNYPLVRNIPNASATSESINNLAAGTYYFVVAAYDLTGNESVYSSVASKTISIQ